MAVVQISKIQARRGLQQDLPQLSSAEFGWSVDSQRLYIGNGTMAEGAPAEGVTEILTSKNLSDSLPEVARYTFQGNVAGYVAVTGYDLNHPIVRSFQVKFDETVSIKDFGAKGDGSTDDTAAINRAFTEVYRSSQLLSYTQIRRRIYFPAGVYIVTGDIIRIPPWCTVVGEGIQNTVIRQTDSSQPSLIKFADSSYQVGSSVGSGGATAPQYINIEHLTLENTSDRDVVIIDGAKHVNFSRVEFKGPLSNPTSDSGSYTGVRFKSSAVTTERINFDFCKFTNTRYAMISDELVKNIVVNASYFSGLYKGIKLGQFSTSAANTPVNFRIANSTFASVSYRAIDCYSGVTGIVSCGNHFEEVGNNFQGAGAPTSTIINFVSDGNYSVFDTFDRNDSDNEYYNRVEFGTVKTAYLSANVGLVLGTATIGSGGTMTLLDNQTSIYNTGLELPVPCKFNYSISRSTYTRTGTITVTNDSSVVQYLDNYTSSDHDPGVTLIINDADTLTYRTSNLGINATLKYNITHF